MAHLTVSTAQKAIAKHQLVEMNVAAPQEFLAAMIMNIATQKNLLKAYVL